ncbi:hypothetical protein BDW02DRAFT_599220 [Decorospora gaudefroyi]|uniref:Uncharacterized protein n=1 Tax=Decorospora gaudefroyi TaxID=184978 RepID=A0A6A5KDV1_9PLEO|nr:hypothetical protein BDW02DRAFT_599220 [Decorospora gaudefroyi]
MASTHPGTAKHIEESSSGLPEQKNKSVGAMKSPPDAMTATDTSPSPSGGSSGSPIIEDVEVKNVEIDLPDASTEAVVDTSKDIVEAKDTKENQGQDDTAVKNEAQVTKAAGKAVEKPHIRSQLHPPAHYQDLPQASKRITLSEVVRTNQAARLQEGPRGPRTSYAQYDPCRTTMNREHVNGAVLRWKNESEAELKKTLNLRKTIEAEQQQKFEAATSSMLSNLFREQAEALELQARYQAKMRDLEYREKRIEQTEVYLSEGQKQLFFSLEQNEIRLMSAVQMEFAHREAELHAKKTLADAEAKLAIKMEALEHRDAAVQMREQQYKALIRDAIVAEAGAISPEKTEEISDVAYNDGFVAGKDQGRKEGQEQAHQKGFLEGYSACHQTQVALAKFRKGDIPGDSPELDFLHDLEHPHNMFQIGSMTGRMGAGPSADVKTNTPPSIKDKYPPPRPTLAATLRGPVLMHNGQIVLANHAAAKKVQAQGGQEVDKVANLIDLM